MIKYVFDTNSIISANLLGASVTRQAYYKVLEEGVLLYSKETLSELVQVFSRPKFDKYLSIEKRINAVAAFEKKGFAVDVSIKVNACRDPKDNKFLELALTGKADCVITGDKDLLVLHPFHGISILTPGDFLKSFS